MKHLYKTALMLALLTPPAVAQVKQTAEGAHQFLAITTAAGGVDGFVDAGPGENAVNAYYSACNRQSGTCGGRQYVTWNAPAYKAVNYKYMNACKGSVIANSPYYESMWDENRSYPNYRMYYAPPLANLDRILDWSKVVLVQRVENSITIKEGNLSYRFVLPGVDIATRMAFAMEFLRIDCDPSASTGF